MVESKTTMNQVRATMMHQLRATMMTKVRATAATAATAMNQVPVTTLVKPTTTLVSFYFLPIVTSPPIPILSVCSVWLKFGGRGFSTSSSGFSVDSGGWFKVFKRATSRFLVDRLTRRCENNPVIGSRCKLIRSVQIK